MIIKAKELGMITIYETERKNGSQTSNLFSFNRFPQSEPPKTKKLDHPKETNNLSKTNNQKSNKRNEAPIELYSYFFLIYWLSQINYFISKRYTVGFDFNFIL
jgi:hypothetical protein